MADFTSLLLLLSFFSLLPLNMILYKYITRGEKEDDQAVKERERRSGGGGR